ncbi:MAG: ATP-binding protein [Chloroflexota bacterium]|nr:ATP-binding protein [Chloroflexota bacterium]
MLDSTLLSLIINAITAPLSLAFLLLLTWSDLRREINPFFGVFLAFIVIWNGGALIVQASLLAELSPDLLRGARIALDLGFTGAGIAAFALTAVIVKAYTRRLRGLSLVALLTILLYRFLQLTNTPEITDSAYTIIYRAQPLLVVFFVIFGGGTLLLLWQNRRAVRSPLLRVGLTVFVVAQLFGFANPQFGLWATANNLGVIAALCISMALIRQEMIRPLAERTSQVETLRRVSAGIINQESLPTQLAQILERTALLVRADGAGIYGTHPQGLTLIDSWQLPTLTERTIAADPSGMAMQAMKTRRTIHVDHYGREWRGGSDFPFARETFGSVVCTPITHTDETLGVLMVVSARQGRLFRTDDLYLLEMLATQIAVALTYHRLFEHQKELDRLKNEMLRMASHDLKNPLQASMANLDLLRDDLVGHPLPDVHESIEVIDKQLRRMSRIIRGVLDLEKLRDGKVQLAPYPAAQLIDRAVDELREYARDQKITLHIESLTAIEGIEVLCDARQLERALVNLIENGLKFTASQGTVSIGAMLDSQDTRVVFKVKDNGVGIAEEHQPHVFDRFYRASPQGMEHVNGSGLGLSLVKAAVSNHHGDVWFHSHEGVGTTFFVAIPVAQTQSAAPLE